MTSINLYNVSLYTLSQGNILMITFKLLIQNDDMILEIFPGPFSLNTLEEFVTWKLLTPINLGDSCIKRKQNDILISIRDNGHNLTLYFGEKVSTGFIATLKTILSDAKKGSVKDTY